MDTDFIKAVIDAKYKAATDTYNLYNRGTLNYKSFLYLLKTIVDFETGKAVRFLPSYPRDLVPDSTNFIFNADPDLDQLSDTITYKLVFETGANKGGPKKPHANPKLQKPQTINIVEHPYNEEKTVTIDMIEYDTTIQFDLFCGTHTQLLDMAAWFRRMCFNYRDFITHMGVGEFIYQRRFTDDILEQRYAKYAIPHTSFQFYLKWSEFYLKETTKLKEIVLTINNEVIRRYNENTVSGLI